MGFPALFMDGSANRSHQKEAAGRIGPAVSRLAVPLFHEDSGGETREDWDALDVTVGDFRGTGKIEIATISSHKCDVWAKIWEVSGSSISKTADLGDVGTLPENKDVPGYLRCMAGDLDGDGRDEFIWAGCDRHTDSGKIALVVHTNLNEHGGLSFYKCAAQYPLEGNAGHPIFDLALGYFSEGYIPSDTGYPNQMQIVLAVRVSDDEVNRRGISWDGQDFSMGDPSSVVQVDFTNGNDYPHPSGGQHAPADPVSGRFRPQPDPLPADPRGGHAGTAATLGSHWEP